MSHNENLTVSLKIAFSENSFDANMVKSGVIQNIYFIEINISLAMLLILQKFSEILDFC